MYILTFTFQNVKSSIMCLLLLLLTENIPVDRDVVSYFFGAVSISKQRQLCNKMQCLDNLVSCIMTLLSIAPQFTHLPKAKGHRTLKNSAALLCQNRLLVGLTCRDIIILVAVPTPKTTCSYQSTRQSSQMVGVKIRKCLKPET